MSGGASAVWVPSPTALYVDSLSTLSGISLPAPLPDGWLAYVQAVTEYFRFQANSGAPIDGVNVLSTQAGGQTRWIKTTLASGFPAGPAGGDLSGTYPNPQVVGIENYPIEPAPPANGDALLFNGFMNRWEHAPIVFGGGPPVGPAGGDLGGIYPNPQVAGLQNDALPAKVADGFLKRDATNTAWEEVTYGALANTVCQGNDARLSDPRTPTGPAGGDLSGTYPNPTVDGLQARPVAATAPNADDVLTWDGVTWKPVAITTLINDYLPAIGTFSDTTDQPIPQLPSSIAVSYDTTDIADGVTLANNGLGKPTRLTVPTDGVYAFQISPQLYHTGGTGTVVHFWAKVNGLDVPRSASSIEMGNNNNRVLPFLQLDLPMLAGQYLEWYFAQSGINTTLETFPAAAPLPLNPSVIVSVRRVGRIP